jgi:hypothetical protein
MLLPWVRHRRETLRAAPFPSEWEECLRQYVAQWERLTEPERQRLRGDLRVFADEKVWEGANGFVVDDTVQLVISAQACLLMLGWEEPRFFPNVPTIIVYPSGFVARRTVRAGYIETASRPALLGEAWTGDLPVVLSWEDVVNGSGNPDAGHNVVLHEFAHKLDMLDGLADGVPRLDEGHASYEEWASVMSVEYRALRRAAAHRDEHLILDPYGAQNEAEFFAVATEAFFQRPHRLRAEARRLYDLLSAYFVQDTAERWDRWQYTLSPESETARDANEPPRVVEESVLEAEEPKDAGPGSTDA